MNSDNLLENYANLADFIKMKMKRTPTCRTIISELYKAETFNETSSWSLLIDIRLWTAIRSRSFCTASQKN